MEHKKQQAAAWFRALRDRICAEFEAIENGAAFQRKSWQRDGGLPSEASAKEGGGGEMSLMKGAVFEKVGVNISTVHGTFSEAMRKEIPGADADPRFWAGGISLVAHMRSPMVPSVHMNTRMIVVGTEELENCGTGEKKSSIPQFSSSPIPKIWFGGGADLTPTIEYAEDTAEFHAAFKAACDRFNPEYHAKFKKWCDEYFFIPHRGEPRGAGGIFYDYINTGDWQQDFAFTQAVGEAFLDVYPRLVRRRMTEPWTPEQKRAQLIKRGRYAEFNLLYDRGTRFGLQTGGNPEAILMSLPPEAVWE